MSRSLPIYEPEPSTPTAPFRQLTTLWIQVTGTWCNLTCTHCFNASGPRDPWIKQMTTAQVRAAIDEGVTLGVKELYFTGGEPFLHREIVDLIEYALRHAPTTVLTNGTMITETTADRLAAAAAASRYSLEIRLSLDAAEREANDAMRGRGVFDKVLEAARRLETRGLLPIITVSEIVMGKAPAGSQPAGEGSEELVSGPYAHVRDLLLAAGLRRPRIKIIPVFHMGRLPEQDRRLTPAHLEGFDFTLLRCTESRAGTADGVYACPILAGFREARLSSGSLADALRPRVLYHSACVTCYKTGMTCKNF